MPNGRVTLTPYQVRAWQELEALVPGWRVEPRLIAQYAGARGGLTLAFWRLKLGPAFDRPTVWSIERCAEELDVPVSDLARISEETRAWVWPRLEADPAWLQLRRTLRSRGSDALLTRVLRARDGRSRRSRS
jgi:hypothetical protein